MAVSLDLLLGAVVAGILLGGFYAAVTVGVSISFGMLDIVNIAHPAFIILGSYIAYIVNKRLGDESLRGLAFFFGLLFITEVALILVFGVDYRFVDAAYIGYTLHYGPIDLPLRMLVPFVCSLALLAGLQLFLSRSFIGRAIMAVSQDRLALQLMSASPARIKRIAFGISIATAGVAGSFLIIIQPVEPSIGRDYIGRVFAACVVGAAVFGLSLLVKNQYYFFAGYVVLQYVVLATAWNILGGYTGYVNFGTAAFFALGAYSTVVLYKLFPMPIPALILVGGAVSGVVGLGMGYLTLRLRGVFFSIATLALAVVVQTLITNWDYVGGSRGAYIIRPAKVAILGNYIEYLFLVMLVLAVVAVAIARTIERSRLGYGFAAIRDDELAAETAGVPTLRLKLVATTLSGALMGMAGAPLPYYVTYLDPASGFNLAYAVNSIAMPLIGGMTSWIGPIIGAVFLGTIQQVATVTISSALNLLIVGVLLVAFVIIAPNGIVGLAQTWLRPRRR